MPAVKRFVLSFAAVMNLVLVDQFVKAAAVFYLKDHPAVAVIPGFFDFAYVENRGAAWGMFQGHVWPLAVFAVLAGVVLIWKRRSVFPEGFIGTVTELLLYAGIIGNLADRVSRGFVVDMFHFHWGIHSFPVFNIADIFICVAAGLLALCGFLQKKKDDHA